MARPRHASTLQFWEALEAFPPILVRLAARRCVAGKNVVALSHQEIAITAGIPLTRVVQISESFSFDDVTVGETRRFCAACNFDPTRPADRERQREYLRQCQIRQMHQPPYYLRHSPWWESQFQPLILRLRLIKTPSIDSERSPLVATKSAA